MPECFGRVARLTIGDLVFEGFRTQFRIEKTSEPQPNTADISVTNLAQATREKLQSEGAKVILEAGYIGETQQIFTGDSRMISHVHDGPNWTTRIQCGDGERSYGKTRVTESFGPGTDVRAVAKKAMEAMGLEMRDAIAALNGGDWKDVQERFWHGVSISGSAAKVLTDALGGSGYRWSIQDGVLQVVARGKTVEDQTGEEALVLSRQTGLIGTPELGDKGWLKIRALVNGRLAPGRKVVLDSDPFKGAFRIETAVHLGDTDGAEWYSEIEATPL